MMKQLLPPPLLLFLAVLCLFPAPSVFAACSLVLEVPTDRLEAESLAWSGCAGSGVGVQAALDAIEAEGGGSLLFTGTGSLLVDRTLFVGSNTLVHGDPARRPYGMLIEGRNGTKRGFRRRPIFAVMGVKNVKIQNFEFRGTDDPEAPHFHGPAIAILEAENIEVEHNKSVSVRMGLVIKKSSRVTISHYDLEMVRSRAGMPEGGAGIWLYDSSYSTLEHNDVYSPEYYAAGPPSNTDHRPLWENAAPAMDLIATHGGYGNTIRDNRVSKGNTAGIYVACRNSAFTCAAGDYEENLLISHNVVRQFRQHGVDIAHALSPVVSDNTIGEADFALLALGNVHGGLIQHNRLQGGGLDRGGVIYGALHVLWGSSGNTAVDNEIHGGLADFAVYLKPASSGYPDPAGNVVQDNDLWKGSSSPAHIGGYTNGNATLLNNLH